MLKNEIENIDLDVNPSNYVSHKKIKKFNLVKKSKIARLLLFWAPIVQIATSVIFLVLLLLDYFFSNKIGLGFSNLQLSLASSYIGVAILVNIICFMLPAKKLKKKNSFRMIGVSTLILSTLIVSGSFIFWTIPTLLFFSLISLLVWWCEIIAAIMLILIVEELPNEKHN